MINAVWHQTNQEDGKAGVFWSLEDPSLPPDVEILAQHESWQFYTLHVDGVRFPGVDRHEIALLLTGYALGWKR